MYQFSDRRITVLFFLEPVFLLEIFTFVFTLIMVPYILMRLEAASLIALI